MLGSCIERENKANKRLVSGHRYDGTVDVSSLKTIVQVYLRA